MPATTPSTLGELLAWSYANLGMAHAALRDESSDYGRTHFMIRAKLYKGLRTGSMKMRPLLDDDRVKMTAPRGCAYCGSDLPLTLDHLIPRSAGGPDSADNSVWACRRCNSSKHNNDMLSWWFRHNGDRFPPLLLIRRYLKVATQLARRAELMERTLDSIEAAPFDISSIPTKYPAPAQLCLWATLDQRGSER